MSDDDTARAREQIHRMVAAFRRKAWGLFLSAMAGSALLWWLGAWAGEQSGWEAHLLFYVFTGAASIGSLLSLFAVALVRGTYTAYDGAMGSAELYVKNPEAFKKVYQEAVGPIPW